MDYLTRKQPGSRLSNVSLCGTYSASLVLIKFMCTLPSTTFNLFFVLLSELNRRLPGGHPGWPRWLHFALASLLGSPQERPSTHTYPTPNSGTSPAGLFRTRILRRPFNLTCPPSTSPLTLSPHSKL
ncbi:hypothetical protein AMECASPLE_005674 [Ameca splendens]|uniref:Uncharacterized protein n=1 Tax=Ameca splendens TaxID=208324 RepID=A0ABV1A5G3_9TELE